MKQILKLNHQIHVFFVILITGLFSGNTGLCETKADLKSFRIFSSQPKLIVVNGYSTSFQWPNLLQRKLDRYFDGKRIIEVKSAAQAGFYQNRHLPLCWAEIICQPSPLSYNTCWYANAILSSQTAIPVPNTIGTVASFEYPAERDPDI